MFQSIFAAIFICAASVAVCAQSVEQNVKNARDQFSDLKNRSIEMERVKRAADSPPVRTDTTADFPAIKEDFERIQKINSENLQSSNRRKTIDYAAVFKFVTEINHRAARLNARLFASDGEKKKAKTGDAKLPDLPSLLTTLDRSINGFVHNSIFQNLNIINPQDSLKAQEDLEKIITVSAEIREQTRKTLK